METDDSGTGKEQVSASVSRGHVEIRASRCGPGISVPGSLDHVLKDREDRSLPSVQAQGRDRGPRTTTETELVEKMSPNRKRQARLLTGI